MITLPFALLGIALASAAGSGGQTGDYFIAGNMQYLQAATGCLLYSTEGKFMAFSQGITCVELYAKYPGDSQTAAPAPAPKGHQ